MRYMLQQKNYAVEQLTGSIQKTLKTFMLRHVLKSRINFGSDFCQLIAPFSFAVVSTNQPFEQFPYVYFYWQVLRSDGFFYKLLL